jgi:hypothetical protein
VVGVGEVAGVDEASAAEGLDDGFGGEVGVVAL